MLTEKNPLTKTKLVELLTPVYTNHFMSVYMEELINNSITNDPDASVPEEIRKAFSMCSPNETGHLWDSFDQKFLENCARAYLNVVITDEVVAKLNDEMDYVYAYESLGEENSFFDVVRPYMEGFAKSSPSDTNGSVEDVLPVIGHSRAFCISSEFMTTGSVNSLGFMLFRTCYLLENGNFLNVAEYEYISPDFGIADPDSCYGVVVRVPENDDIHSMLPIYFDHLLKEKYRLLEEEYSEEGFFIEGRGALDEDARDE